MQFAIQIIFFRYDDIFMIWSKLALISAFTYLSCLASSVRIRVAPPDEPSPSMILELALHRMEQSPNISRVSFTHVQGDQTQFEGLRHSLLTVFNEVL